MHSSAADSESKVPKTITTLPVIWTTFTSKEDGEVYVEHSDPEFFRELNKKVMMEGLAVSSQTYIYIYICVCVCQFIYVSLYINRVLLVYYTFGELRFVIGPQRQKL